MNFGALGLLQQYFNKNNLQVYFDNNINNIDNVIIVEKPTIETIQEVEDIPSNQSIVNRYNLYQCAINPEQYIPSPFSDEIPYIPDQTKNI